MAKSTPVKAPPASGSVRRTPDRSTLQPTLSRAATLQRNLHAPGAASPSQVLSLQRSIGNRAVQRLLSPAPVQREPVVGPEGGEVGPEVQDQLARASAGGRPLDSSVGAKVGGALGADFTGVRVHTDSEADALNHSLGAQAFTHGSDIFFSRGAYNPGSSGGQRLLAHELTHVVQQGGGKANKVQTKLQVGPAGDSYEREADAVADQALSAMSAGPRFVSPDRPGAARRSPLPGAGPRIQRTVKMYESFDDARKASKNEPIKGTETQLTVADLDTAFTNVVTEMQNAGVTLTAKTKTKMKSKLKEWILKEAQMSQVTAWLKKKFTGGTSLNTGRAQDKRFASYLTLGQALMGHIESRQHKKTESKLAAKIKKSSYIKGKLREVQRAVFQAVEAITDQQIKDKFWGGMSGNRAQARPGHYYHWYKNVKNVKNMMQYGTGDFKQAIASIHDVGDVMIQVLGVGSTKKESLAKGGLETWATNEDFQGTVEKGDGTGGTTTSRENITIGYRANSTTVNEENDWVKTARAHGMLLWAGPSHTTANMMRMMRSLQEKIPAIDVSHFEAVAWAIFAFWNKDFFTFKDGYHTFHEVMDVAKGYGVPYEPFSYPAEPPPARTDTDSEESSSEEGGINWTANPLYQG